ncbi:MAG: TetR/AcrR family transcriptional regulator [Chloroflexi bacterium]|nr:TetR/AcrR family transcriptional regulator [Chloroflexota bacterium]
MKQPKMDRRIQRTRQLLQNALSELILEKGYEAVTVQDILDRANLGRSTFYAHYTDKDALFLSGFEVLRQVFEDHTKGWMAGKGLAHGKPTDLWRALFQHASANQRYYKAMLGKRSGDMLLKHVREYLLDHVRKNLKALARSEKKLGVPLDVQAEFVVSSFLALLTWWLDRDMPYSPEQMVQMLEHLVMPGLNRVLGSKTLT